MIGIRNFLIPATLVMAIFWGGSAPAASLQKELERARALLDAGDAAAAEELYRELQVEAPESGPVIFGLACAQYLAGKQQAAAQSPDLAAGAFDAARETFQQLISLQDKSLRESAVFNQANCLAQKAKLLDPMQQYDARVAALREAVTAYETILRENPEHAGAQQNLDHTRFLLKTLLQEPPEKQDQEDQEQQDQPPDQPPQGFSLFTEAGTDLPGARAIAVDNTARVLRLPPREEAEP
jgi:tetratricopeptide (TPR) repeat protein